MDFYFLIQLHSILLPGSEEINEDRLVNAAEIANIKGFIESLPLGYNTKIGANGHGLSEGQKQRLLIARVIYKNPDIIIFDEATNSLDANNEKVIVENLTEFFEGKTVIIVAHRLSTVRNADKIVVLDSGRIVETGTHETLIANGEHILILLKTSLNWETRICSMKERKPEILYSDPVKEIMGNPPRRILRWGTLYVFGICSVYSFCLAYKIS